MNAPLTTEQQEAAYLAQLAENKHPVKRLWLQSMTPQAIRDGASARRDHDVAPPQIDLCETKGRSRPGAFVVHT